MSAESDMVEPFGCFKECNPAEKDENKRCEFWCRTPLGPYRNSCWARMCEGPDLYAWCDNGLGMGIGVPKSCEGCCTTDIEYDYIDKNIVPKKEEDS